MYDHEYFFINDDLFDIIQSTHQYNNISLNIISNECNKNYSQCDAMDISDDKICKKKRIFGNNIPPNNIQRRKHKITVDYINKSFDDFRLMNIDPPQKLAYEE